MDPAKVRFVTRGGTEYTPESFDGESGDYVLSLVGGQENDGQELYALYPKPGGGYYNLGKLLIVSYPSYRFSVKVVSVGGGLPGGEYSVLSDYMKVFFSRYGIACDVSYDETDYSDLELFDKGSGILSAYNSRMKSFQRHYAETHPVDESCSYLFIFPESGHKGKRDFSGFMPRGCQFGYVFRQDFRGFDSFCLAVVHELCHGRFVLKHTFDSSYGLFKGSTDNLMDYTEGASHLAKWQWDVIHDPGVVVRIFERDEDGALATGDSFDRLVTLMHEAGASGCAFIQRCESSVFPLRDGEIKFSYEGRYYRCVVGNYRDGMIFPKQSPDGGNVWNIDEKWLKQFFTGIGDSQNIVLYEKAGTTKTCMASEDYSDFSTLSDPWESASFLSRWSSDLSRCMSLDNAFASDRTYQLESLSLSEMDILDRELVELVGNPLFRHLRFHVSLTTVSGKHSDYKSFSDGDADITLKYLIDDVTRQVHVKLEYNESLFSSSLSSPLSSRAKEYGISEGDLRKESVEAMRLLKEEVLRAEGFWSGLRQLILGTTKQVQVCGNIGKSIWDTGEIPKGLWLISDNGYSYYKDNSFTLGQIPAGVSDGVIGELFGLPLMIKTVGEIVIDREKREAFGHLFSWDGLEAMWEGLKEEYSGSWNDPNRRQYIVSKTTIDIASLFVGGGLVSKGAGVAKASNDGKVLIQEGIARFSKEVPGPKALKGLTGEMLNQRKALLANLNKKLSTEQIEKALHFVPLEDVEDFLNLLDRLKDNSTLNKVLPQLGEFYNKDKGARFVLKYAGSFPPDVINTIKFEQVVHMFGLDEVKRVYDFVIDGKKYELKAWTKWAHWSDDAFLNQFVKDIASIGDLENLQWVFMRTEDITEENLHKYIMNALKTEKCEQLMNRYVSKEKLEQLFGTEVKSKKLGNALAELLEQEKKLESIFIIAE